MSTATVALADRYKVLDADSHIIEPPDLWSSKLSARYGSAVPHVVFDAESNEERWVVNDYMTFGAGAFAMAGWPEYYPSRPMRFEQVDPAHYSGVDRLKKMDEYGIHYQVLYSNVLGFQGGLLVEMAEPRLALDCVRVYNDWLIEFAEADSQRLIPIAMVPFWDLDEAIIEMRRAVDIGHRGVAFASNLAPAGLPKLSSDHWDPLFRAATDLGISVNFHSSFMTPAKQTDAILKNAQGFDKLNFVLESSMAQLGGMRTAAELALGVCHRHPDLQFVIVESGAGWLPALAENLDWQWMSSGCADDMPERAMPSEHLHNQVKCMYWYEQRALRMAAEDWSTSLLYETDFPHPTSMSPGPASFAQNPRDVMESSLAGLSEQKQRDILIGNAASLYGITDTDR